MIMRARDMGSKPGYGGGDGSESKESQNDTLLADCCGIRGIDVKKPPPLLQIRDKQGGVSY